MSGTISDLKASDLMQRDVVTIGPRDTLRMALDLMTENHITALPVMDGHDRCVGLISATDILNFEHDHAEEADQANSDVAPIFNPDRQQWESIRTTAFALEEFGDVKVEEVMARDLVFVERSSPIDVVARKLIEAEIHRVLVLGGDFRLYGIVSAVDIVRFLAER